MDLTDILTDDERKSLLVFAWHKVHFIKRSVIQKDHGIGTTEFDRRLAKGMDVYLDLVLLGFAGTTRGDPMTLPSLTAYPEHEEQLVLPVANRGPKPTKEQQQH